MLTSRRAMIGSCAVRVKVKSVTMNSQLPVCLTPYQIGFRSKVACWVRARVRVRAVEPLP